MTEPQTAKPARATSNSAKPRYNYIAHNDKGDLGLFSDELEAYRFAFKGALEGRVEKTEVQTRTKSAK